MKLPYESYIKKGVIAVAIIYGIGNILYGLSTTPDPSNTPETKVVENTNPPPSHQPTEPSKPLLIDIFPRMYTTGEVYARFQEHEFRAKNDFKNCRLMITGKITDIGTVTFSKKPLVTLSIPGSDEGLKFIFEDTDSNNDEVAALDIGKPIVIAGRNARSGSFGGVFLDDSILMSDMLSKELHKQRKILVPNGGIFDRVICRK
ncbi:hypothetical protein [Klebsiella pasteurii]|uniref:hypothetical protein n=1 Tax=Klebsiella pasteurii TaxID=2587529 RepID=UPI00292BFF2F|nr:hypothetical protein [Klebsiella pasteurii]MDV1072656.1 hypothetical protein [Klebsiella pasteurii]MDV1078543.1 hypothetical protein [Klebsiella pasteurii]